MQDLNSSFVGMGHNPAPGVPDIPMGLGMRIAQDPRAMQGFTQLSDDHKRQLIGYVQAAQTGDEAKERVRNAVSMLNRGTWEL